MLTQPNPGNRINLVRIAEECRAKIYDPIKEAVINSLQAIEEGRQTKGRVEIILHRCEKQTTLQQRITPIKDIEVIDNGIGFTKANKESFREYRSDKKIELGGKGFGRLSFLKHFHRVEVNSIFKQGINYMQRSFTFDQQRFVGDERERGASNQTERTSVKLVGLKSQSSNKMDKSIHVIARHIFEELL